MHKGFLTTAAILGALAVALGAFGAHALKELLTPQSLNTYDTAVRYQFYHVFALALTGILAKEYPGKWTGYAGRCFITGIILFSGSLYLLTAFTASGNNSLRWLGAITPLGGVFFILGWLSLAYAIGKSKS
jgi:uncharacterized membrane protein YgdD (TMEM256/DUF423 family)